MTCGDLFARTPPSKTNPRGKARLPCLGGSPKLDQDGGRRLPDSLADDSMLLRLRIAVLSTAGILIAVQNSIVAGVGSPRARSLRLSSSFRASTGSRCHSARFKPFAACMSVDIWAQGRAFSGVVNT